MRQGWKAAAVITLAAVLGATPVRMAAAAAAPKATTSPSKSNGAKLRQFTGYVTTVDGKSLTVEKRGKNPRTLVFTRDESTRSEGDVAKNSRVTVHYREDGDRHIAQRVVARPNRRGAPGSR